MKNTQSFSKLFTGLLLAGFFAATSTTALAGKSEEKGGGGGNNGVAIEKSAKASSPTQYRCEIQQTNFVDGKFIEKTYAMGGIDLAKSGSLVVDMPRTPNDPNQMRVILDIGTSLDKSKLHVGFTAIDKHGSANSSDWDFAFQIESEFDLETKFISLQSVNSVYSAEFSCKLLTI
jgi:hypothetical protein